MKVIINFKEINPGYDQKYADTYQDGKESDGNWKYNWANGYEVSDVHSVSLIENEAFLLKGIFENGEYFESEIPNVTIFRCHLQDETKVDFAVSKSILNKTHQAKNEKYDVTRFYFYINPEPASFIMGDSLVIDERDVPKELRKAEKSF